ncbi:MAG: glutathione binding-like protein [Gammaproteobacteria bacterium]|nr:glutathione binding-like protein [Gammaproteobacteria bacterium]
MIDFYFWTTPNGYKVLMLLEEAGIAYRIKPINISQGEQFEPYFLEISPNNKIPAIVDHSPAPGEQPVSIFESGAIMLHLAEKTHSFLPKEITGRNDVLQWLFWQVGGVGPMFGQNLHFGQYAPDKIPYAVNRYTDETSRLFKVLDRQLDNRRYIVGDKYTIADMATYPWIFKHPVLGIDLDDYPNVKRWFDRVAQRSATIRAYDIGATINTTPTITEESKAILLGQSNLALAE